MLSLLVFPFNLFAAWEEEPQISTNPIGSPYYRHLANEFRLDLHQLEKFEKKGFGRSEIVALIIISSTTGKSLRDIGNRRLKEQVSLKQLAEEAHLDHDKLMLESKRVKEQIEAMGDKNLPPPIYEMGEIIAPTPSPVRKTKPKPNGPTPKSKGSEID